MTEFSILPEGSTSLSLSLRKLIDTPATFSLENVFTESLWDACVLKYSLFYHYESDRR